MLQVLRDYSSDFYQAVGGMTPVVILDSKKMQPPTLHFEVACRVIVKSTAGTINYMSASENFMSPTHSISEELL